MSYSFSLDDLNKRRLEELAKKNGTSVPKLVEQILSGYLDFVTRNPDPLEISEKGGPEEETAGYSSLYRWNETKGSIVFTPANRRVFIVNGRSWSALERDLDTKFGKGAEYLMLEMGAAYGGATALDYRAITGDPENIASFFEHLGLVAGWGKFQLAGDLAKGSRITVRVSDCVFCGPMKESAEPSQPCSFLVGVCKGIADIVFDVSHTAHETKCRERGYEFCEIAVWEAKGGEAPPWPPGSNPMTGNPSR